MGTDKDAEKPRLTADDFQAILDQLNVDQIRFVVARQQFSTDKDAAESIGTSPATVKQWKYNGAPIDDAVRLLALDGIVLAKHIRRNNLAKAMLRKVDGLNSDDERLMQSVATEIIEWELGKAPQRVQADVNAKQEISFDDWNIDDLRTFIRLTSRALGTSEESTSAEKPD